MERIRLLAVIDHLGGGGAEGQFLELVKRLDRGRFDTRVVLTEGGGRRLDDALRSGLFVYRHSDLAMRSTRRALRLLKYALAEHSPHVVMAWLSYSITLAAHAAGGSFDGRLMFSERSSLERLFNEEVRFGPVKKYLLKRALRRASAVVLNSKAVAEEFVDLGYISRPQGRVIHNGVDIERLSSLPPRGVLRERLGLKPGNLYGIYVGKYEFRKGITYLIDALGGIDRPGFEFIAIGYGGLEGVVEDEGRVRNLGYRENAAEYIKASDFLVLPSLYEGLPNVVLEAMAVGTPVVATSVYGTPEAVEDGRTGVLVRPADAGDLRAAISMLASDGPLRRALSEEALIKVRQFEMQKMVSAFEGLLTDVAGGIECFLAGRRYG